MLPLLVSTACDPVEARTAARPVEALRNVIVLGPANVNRSAVVCTWPGSSAVTTLTSSGNGQRRESTAWKTCADGARARATAAAAAAARSTTITDRLTASD